MNYGGGTGNPATRALIQFTVTIPQGTPNTVIGSYFLVDDVAFGAPNSVKEVEGALPHAYTLQQNYPNPFNPSTNIRFSIPEQSHVRLRVFNLLGEEVSSLVNEELRGGNYVAEWNAAGLASGTYFYVLNANGRVLSKRMILTK
jgi:hypothetical protein